MERRILTAESGFTLVESILAAGIAIGLLWAILFALSQSTNKWQLAQARWSLDQAVEELRMALLKKESCRANFKDLTWNATTGRFSTARAVHYYDEAGRPLEPIVAVREIRFGHVVSTIEIVPRANLGGGRWIGDLAVSAEPVQGGPPLRRSIVLAMTVSGSRIADCTTGIDPETEIRAKSCPIASSGKTEWDESTGDCEFSGQVTKRGGTPQSSSCATGESVAAFLPDRCHANCPVSADPAGIITRVYEDGTVITQQPIAAACVMTADGSGCECHYAPGVDSSKCTTYAYCARN